MEKEHITPIEVLRQGGYFPIVVHNDNTGFYCFKNKAEGNPVLESRETEDADSVDSYDTSEYDVDDAGGLLLIDDKTTKCLEVDIITLGSDEELNIRRRSIQQKIGIAAIYSKDDYGHKKPIDSVAVEIIIVGNKYWIHSDKKETKEPENTEI